jgi:hypothetical protein
MQRLCHDAISVEYFEVSSMDVTQTDVDEFERGMSTLKAVVETRLNGASPKQIAVAKAIGDFVAWHADPRPETSEKLDFEDKFADLVKLARERAECLEFFSEKIGAGVSTIWRWSNRRSRPSRYVVGKVVSTVKRIMVERLLDDAAEVGLIDADDEIRRRHRRLSPPLELFFVWHENRRTGNHVWAGTPEAAAGMYRLHFEAASDAGLGRAPGVGELKVYKAPRDLDAAGVVDWASMESATL